jgi:hypothetical protein
MQFIRNIYILLFIYFIYIFYLYIYIFIHNYMLRNKFLIFTVKNTLRGYKFTSALILLYICCYE